MCGNARLDLFFPGSQVHGMHDTLQRPSSTLSRYPNLDVVLNMIIGKVYQGIILLLSVNDHPFTVVTFHRIGRYSRNIDLVDGIQIPVVHLEFLPVIGYAGQYSCRCSFDGEAQKGLGDESIHPSGRPRIPGPSAAS